MRYRRHNVTRQTYLMFGGAVLLLLLTLLFVGDSDRAFSLALSLRQQAAVTTAFETGKVWNVGPTRHYKKPSDVAGLVGDGDTILIDGAVYECDAGVQWRGRDLTLRGINGRPYMKADGCTIPGGKGIWNPLGTNFQVENIEFSGADVPSNNGAGIRYDGSGLLLVKNSYFHHNENGILFTPYGTGTSPTDPYENYKNVEVVIQNSEFAYNGYQDGRSHGIYITKPIAKLTVRDSYFHHTDTGNQIKTLASVNYIINNRIEDGDTGNSSYNLDLHSESYVVGNILSHNAKSFNAQIAFAGETANPTGERNSPNKRLFVAYNTFVSDKPHEGVVKVWDREAVLNNDPRYWVKELRFFNNVYVGYSSDRIVLHMSGTGDTTRALLEEKGNIITDGMDLVNRPQGNYYLKANSFAIDASVPLTGPLANLLTPERQYVHPFSSEARSIAGQRFDVGALEYTTAPPSAPTLSFSAESLTIPYNTTATLQWSAINTTLCTATSDWFGQKSPNGSETVGPLTFNKTFVLTCQGKGGSATKSVDISVLDNPVAENFPDYEWVRIPGTKILPLCSRYPWPFKGSSSCGNKRLSAAFDTAQNDIYYWGGATRNYWGNEVYKMDLNTLTLTEATTPTDPRDTTNFNTNCTVPSGTCVVTGTSCKGVWNLKSGGIVPAPAITYASFTYIPTTKKILKQSGQVACSSSVFDDDGWYFDPVAKSWTLLTDQASVSGAGALAIYDRVSGRTLLATESGIHEFHPSSGTYTNLGSSGPLPWSATVAIDEGNRLLVFLGEGIFTKNHFSAVDISGLTTGAISLPPRMTADQWTITGDTSILDAEAPSMGYDSTTGNLVAWDGSSKVFFLDINKAAKTLTIVAKRIDNGPTFIGDKFDTLTYVPAYKSFIVYAGAHNDFYFLKGPGAVLPTLPAEPEVPAPPTPPSPPAPPSDPTIPTAPIPPAPPATPPPTVPATPPVGLTPSVVTYFTFDQATVSGSQVDDKSGKGNSGSLTGGLSLLTLVEGQFSEALSFDGLDDYVVVKNSPSIELPNTGGTIAAWIKSDVSQMGQNRAWPIFWKLEHTNPANPGGVSLELHQSGANDSMYLTSRFDTQFFKSNKTPIRPDIWYHVAVTWDENNVTLYLNGSVEASGAKTGVIVDANNAPAWIGRIRSTSSVYTYADGLIDELQVYNYTLSAPDIAGLASEGTSTPQPSQPAPTPGKPAIENPKITSGLSGHWSFDDSDTDTSGVTDLSGSGNNGTFTGGLSAGSLTDGVFGEALSFNGTDDNLIVAHSPSIELSNDQGTIMGWVKSDVSQMGQNRAWPIFWKLEHTNPANAGGVSLELHQSGQNDPMYLTSRFDTQFFKGSKTPIRPDTWYHVAVTWDNSTATLYINGDVEASGDKTGVIVDANDAPAWIGRIRSTSSVYTYAGGLMDDVRVYSRTLSQGEIRTIHAGSVTMPTPAPLPPPAPKSPPPLPTPPLAPAPAPTPQTPAPPTTPQSPPAPTAPISTPPAPEPPPAPAPAPAPPADTQAPTLTNIVVSALTHVADIMWNSNEPATSIVSYGTNRTVFTDVASTPALKTSHRVTLPGLAPNTTYYYKLLSSDASGNTAELSGDNYVFATEALPPSPPTTPEPPVTPTPPTPPAPEPTPVPPSLGGSSGGGSPDPTLTPPTAPPRLATPTIRAPQITVDLSRGSRGAEVKALQEYLIARGFLRSGLDTGFYGTQTTEAVRILQCEQGIVCSGSEQTTGWGSVGSKTRERFDALSGVDTIPVSQAPPPESTLEQFSAISSGSFRTFIRHPQVKVLQELLNRDPDTRVSTSGAGSPGRETDFYGSRTERAVQKFQCKHGIVCSGSANTTGYGRVGPLTLAKLQEVYGLSAISDPLNGSSPQASPPVSAPVAPQSPQTSSTPSAQSASEPPSLSATLNQEELPTARLVESFLSADLARGARGVGVHILQQILNADSSTRIFDSEEVEDRFFGQATEDALKRFQCKYGIVCSGSPETTGYGKLDRATRDQMRLIVQI